MGGDTLRVKVNYKNKCKCTKEKQKRRMVNYEMMWHEGDIICDTCTGFVRFFDAG